MKTTKNIGDRGEELAKEFLLAKGYTLLSQNYRYKRAEIDLVVQQNETLVFVEVKYRKNANYGFPENAVSAKKEELLLMAGEAYVFQIDWQKRIRFDIISIVGEEIEHFQDAF